MCQYPVDPQVPSNGAALQLLQSSEMCGEKLVDFNSGIYRHGAHETHFPNIHLVPFFWGGS